MKKPGVTAAAVALLLAMVTGCGPSSDPEAGGQGVAGEQTTLMVFAAASLEEPFEEIGAEFEAAREGVTVEFNVTGSSRLVTQIQEGAPADVFASADTANMDKLVASDLDGSEPVDFTSNTLMIAVPAGNPAGITDLASLSDDSLALVTCAPEVPCGAAAATVAASAGVEFAPVSEEQSVTDVLGKVSTGEADAGLVYVTDVRAAGGQVEGVGFPEAAEAANTYPIATVQGAAQAELGQEFIDLVLAETGQEILDAHGFTEL